MDRRSFFQKTVGAVVTATIAGKVTLNGKEFDATQLLLKGSAHDKSAYMLSRALEFASTHPNTKSLIVVPTFERMVFIVESVNFPHFNDVAEDSNNLSYSNLFTTFTLGNGSTVKVSTASNPNQVLSYETNAAWAHELDTPTRNLILSRARLEPRLMEWA